MAIWPSWRGCCQAFGTLLVMPSVVNPVEQLAFDTSPALGGGQTLGLAVGGTRVTGVTLTFANGVALALASATGWLGAHRRAARLQQQPADARLHRQRRPRHAAAQLARADAHRVDALQRRVRALRADCQPHSRRGRHRHGRAERRPTGQPAPAAVLRARAVRPAARQLPAVGQLRRVDHHLRRRRLVHAGRHARRARRAQRPDRRPRLLPPRRQRAHLDRIQHRTRTARRAHGRSMGARRPPSRVACGRGAAGLHRGRRAAKSRRG